MGLTEKICVICGESCADRPRVKDRAGHYYCRACHDEALARRLAPAAAPPPQQAAPPAAEEDIYALTPEPVPQRSAPPTSPDPADAHAAAPPSPSNCPGCDHPLPAGAQICVHCGVNVRTGRSLVTSRGLDEDKVFTNTERVLRVVSWPSPFGVSPVASEAMGLRRPYTTWAIAALTVLISFWFWFSSPDQMQSRKNLMLWAGNAPPSAELIHELYQWTDWGDEQAFNIKMRQIARERGYETTALADLDGLTLDAYAALSPRQQALGQFHGYQLLTHALLHGDIFHLLGNMVFLLIFGSRVNALIGNISAAVLYPILAAVAALAYLPSVWNDEPMPMVGASGAIMALAGMYFVLYPVNRMYVAAWFRFLFFFAMKVWTVRGFWVVGFFVALDLLWVSLGAETNVAHWAHLGGFACGMVIALALLFSRVLYAGGSDLLSATLGRHAWTILGRPGDKEKPGLRLPGV